MDNEITVFSDSLKGITIDHEDHRRMSAPMHSTGNVIFTPIDDSIPTTDLFFWCIEYKCDVCHQLIRESDPKYYDLVREVLKDNGYLPSS